MYNIFSMVDQKSSEMFAFDLEDLGSGELWEKIRKIISSFPQKPLTVAGDNVWQSIVDREQARSLFQSYPALSDLIGILIYLFELEKGAELSKSDFFKQQENQLALVKAFGYLSETIFKQENYNHHQKFFNTLSRGLIGLANQIRQQALPNMLNSLTFCLNEAIHTIPGAQKINIKTEGIRKKLSENPSNNLEFDSYFKIAFENFVNSLVPNVQ